MAGNLQIISKLYSKIDVLSIALAWPSIIVQFDLLAYHMTSSCTVWQALVFFDKLLYCLTNSGTVYQALSIAW